MNDLADRDDVLFKVSDAESLIKALHLAQNAFLPQYVITCANARDALGGAPLEELRSAVSIIGRASGDFSRSQLRRTSSAYRYCPLPGEASAAIRKHYMSTAKEVNDVRCVAAEIGGILRSRLGRGNTFKNAVREYQKWINEFFVYKDTGSIDDHTAIGLLRNRAGVCQAIASLTTLVFPHLGYSVHYIGGEGCGGGSWGPHAWNAIKSGGRWIHADFTFGMKSLFTPNSASAPACRSFCASHRWDDGLLSDGMMTGSDRIKEGIIRDPVELSADKETFFIGDVAVRTGVPVMTGGRGSGYRVDLCRVLPYLEGACEYLPKSGCLRICLKDRSFLIRDAMRYIDRSTGYIGFEALRGFAAVEREDSSSVRFRMTL